MTSSTPSKPPNRGNFRANYLEKIGGVQSAEATRLLDEQISGDLDVDIAKLAQFAIKYDLPAGRPRIAVWKLLLGISSGYPESKAVIAQHRNDQARQLLHSLCIMRLASQWANGSEGAIANDLDLVRMIQLDSGRLPLASDKYTWTLDDQARLVLAGQFLNITGEKDNWTDAFWLTKRFDELLASVFTADVLQEIRTEAMETTVSDLLEQLDFWNRLEVKAWLRTGCATVISTGPLHRLWDKLMTGDGVAALLKCTIIRYLKTLGVQLKLKISKSTDEEPFKFKPSDLRLPLEDEEKLVAEAIQMVSRSGKFVSRRSDAKIK